MMNHTTSPVGKALIRGNEGSRLNAYLDNAVPPVPTIGFGSIFMLDGSRVKMGDTITVDQENQLFDKSIAEHDRENNTYLKVELPQNKYDSISDFSYNEGIGRLAGSTLLQKVNADPNDIEIPNEFMKWIYAGKKIDKGLVIRRGRDIALWLNTTLQDVATKWDLLARTMKETNITS